MQRTPEEEIIYSKAPHHARYYLDEPPPSLWEVATHHAGGPLFLLALACLAVSVFGWEFDGYHRLLMLIGGLALLAWFAEARRQAHHAWREERKRRYLFVARLQEATTPPNKETPCSEAESSQDL